MLITNTFLLQKPSCFICNVMVMDSKRLVIDASVAKAAGGEGATHPVAAATRDFLTAVLTICHKVVMTAPMQEEWNKHQSNFARKWRRGMVARKKLIVFSEDVESGIRQAVDDSGMNDSQKQAMLKDCHLVEAALGNDHSIISLDDAARSLFSSATNDINELHSILWMNPVSNIQESLAWLKSGASHSDNFSQQWLLGIEKSNS